MPTAYRGSQPAAWKKGQSWLPRQRTSDFEEVKEGLRREAERNSDRRESKRDHFLAALRRRNQQDLIVGQCGRENSVDIASRKQAAGKNRKRPEPLARCDGSLQHQPFGAEATARRQPHQRQSPKRDGEEGQR